MTETILRISFRELCQFEEISEQTIITMVEYGIAEPLEGEDVANWIFDTNSAHWIKKAVRLNRDLEIDWVAVAMIIELLQEREFLQQQNRSFQRQLKRFTWDS